MLLAGVTFWLVSVTPLFATDILPVLFDLGPAPALTGALEQNYELTKAERYKLNQLVGPVSFAFHRDHIYTGLANGNIVDVSDCGVKLIASLGLPRCSSEQQCGRPMGMRMDGQGRLIVADAHRGIFRINVETGQKEMLYSSSTPVGGRPCKFINDVVVAGDGTILFTDSSARWPRQERQSIILEGQSTGRLLAYSDKSNQAIVVLKNLSFPNGLQLGPNDKYLLIAETGRAKILKLNLMQGNNWLALTDFASNLPGLPDNIRASGRGTYWVAFAQARHQNMTSLIDDYDEQPQMRKIIAKMYSKDQIKSMTDNYGMVVEMNGAGAIVRSLQDPKGLKVDSTTEAIERDGYLYLGSFDKPYISRVATTHQFNVERFLSKLKSTCRATKLNLSRMRVILRRLIAISELRRMLLAAKRRQEEERARRATTTVAPPTDTAPPTATSTTAGVTGATVTSTTTSAAATTPSATSDTSTSTTVSSVDSSSTSSSATTQATATTSSAAPSLTSTSATTPASETTTMDEETGGIVDPTTEAPTTAGQTSEATTATTASATEATSTSETTSSTQAVTESTSVAAATTTTAEAEATSAATTAEATTTASATTATATSTASETTTVTSAASTASSSATTVSTAATT